MEKLAAPLVTVADAIAVDPSRKVTIPVDPAGVIVAVKVVDWPRLRLVEPESVVVTAILSTWTA